MSPAEETSGLRDSGSDSHDRFIGRYSKPLAVALADAPAIEADMRALDVGCGPGGPLRLSAKRADRI
jgi:cyclopropane fatty-acyl-phospholipid synthase-like methyltransferase